MIDQVKDSMRSTLEDIVQPGSIDQIRGYANEAMGKTKIAAGLAIQSCDMTIAGIAQTAIGEIQKLVGEAKLSIDLSETPENEVKLDK